MTKYYWSTPLLLLQGAIIYSCLWRNVHGEDNFFAPIRQGPENLRMASVGISRDIRWTFPDKMIRTQPVRTRLVGNHISSKITNKQVIASDPIFGAERRRPHEDLVEHVLGGMGGFWDSMIGRLSIPAASTQRVREPSLLALKETPNQLQTVRARYTRHGMSSVFKKIIFISKSLMSGSTPNEIAQQDLIGWLQHSAKWVLENSSVFGGKTGGLEDVGKLIQKERPLRLPAASHLPVQRNRIDLKVVHDDTGNEKLRIFWESKAQELKVPKERAEHTVIFSELLFEILRHRLNARDVLSSEISPILSWFHKPLFGGAAQDFSNQLTNRFTMESTEIQRELLTYKSWPEMMNDEKKTPELEKVFVSTVEACDDLTKKLHESNWLNYKPEVILDKLEKFTQELEDEEIVISKT
ncbi:hypothetical protein PSTT_04334, partial [Puccinia striiformis]